MITKLFTLLLILLSCSKLNDIPLSQDSLDDHEMSKPKYLYLALGDSYTIGESVKSSSSFPIQLEKSLENDHAIKIKTEILAKTGWRTDNLLNAIKTTSLSPTYDFVTLLIGVNNQYQGASFTKYKEEFPALLAQAISLAGNNPDRVLVVSIPDWGYTPFGQNRDRQKISTEIERYNTFAETSAEDSDVQFINITDITREGLERPELVANDGLHPSGEAYALFVNRITPIISSKLID